MEVALEPHETLCVALFVTDFPTPLGGLASPGWLEVLLALEVDSPVSRDEPTREAIRGLLRRGGYKPTGRGKPSSEYLVRAAGEGALGSINPAVDACNAVSLASGLPISVIDLARAQPPLRIGLGKPGENYVFNASGQTIDVDGLLCLHDADGPCANPVKDAQRTKTGAETVTTLSVVWACEGLEERLRTTVAWYRELLERAGARTRSVTT